MTFKDTICSICKSPWIIALLLLTLFLSTTSYKYGWDDQHLEIPLLKHLIDSELYDGDYYVESLTKNFSSFFYPILAKLITVDQIPNTYFFLYLLSRYFLFFWIYKLWLLVAKHPLKALCASSAFIAIVRVPEFLYRTFSHQEFALAIIFAGIYYFFKERYILAAIILGLAANIHALYSLFPMYYMGLALLFSIRKIGWKPLILSCAAFFITALPFITWTFSNRFFAPGEHFDYSSVDWLSLFITSCPQNFMFPANPVIPFKQLISSSSVFLDYMHPYLFVFVLYVYNLIFNKDFRTNINAQAFCVGAFSLIGLCFAFTYLHPIRLMIDLNLARNTQFLLFLLIGYTTLHLIASFEKYNMFISLIVASLYPLYKIGNIAGIYVTCIYMGIAAALKSETVTGKKRKYSLIILGSLFAIYFGYLMLNIVTSANISESLKTTFLMASTLLLLNAIVAYWIKSEKTRKATQYLFILIPLVTFGIQFSLYKNKRVAYEQKAGGFWQLQRNWEEMQHYVKENTPKDAMILVPYNMEMGGFRILSERKIICSYRDCGIIGFDYPATQEWQQRVKDIEGFKVIANKSPFNALKNAVTKYDADYVVFMNYAAPKSDNILLTKMFSNSVFTLFKINK